MAAARSAVAVLIVAGSGAIAAAHFALGNQPVIPTIGIAVLVVSAVSFEFVLRHVQRRLNRDALQMQARWEVRQAELQEIAGRDDLTQLQNRRFFYERLQEEMEIAARRHKSLSILMIDVDDLKAINDEFGHQVGDTVLRAFGRILNTHVEENHVTARLGGDEFAVIMPDAGRREADALAWRLWEELAKSPVCETDHASIYLGVSVGTGGYPWGGNDLEEIIHWADTKLYANKLERKGFKQPARGGKDNRLVAAVVDVLCTALDIRDQMTHRHARRVARMAACIAREMNLSQDDVLEIEYAAALHDIGKIGVADSILRKPDALDDGEWRDMRRHSELGYQILKGIDFLHDAADIVHAHHERYDGTGYPRGLAGNEIPKGARVFAVVDAYDAMISKRPYREAIPREAALMEIATNAGTQFDPHVVDQFLVMVRRNPDGFRDDDEVYGSRFENQQAAEEVGSGTQFVPVEP
ncbi:MAG: diguanylate cyclase [Dehalococcoidia bacterium]|nr:diguanylate cyclase [Dehalococcoidia bacterium]